MISTTDESTPTDCLVQSTLISSSTTTLNPQDAHNSQVAREIWKWYTKHARDLPWRNLPSSPHTPWAIMISEFMLQQTPVKRVIPYWHEWLRRWPTPADLAREPVSEAVRAWERLGYPRRAKRLHESAKIIAEKWHNIVPANTTDLLKLPGVGDYTASAIAHFAYGIPAPVVDINIRRVLNRVWQGHNNGTPKKSDQENMDRLMSEISDPNISLPASLMEFGALICTARNPNCQRCPIRDACSWYAQGKPSSPQFKRTQKYAGTDRYVRGLLLELLRSNYKPVDAARLAPLWPDNVQRDRALQSLLKDGLVSEDTPGKYILAQG